MSKEDKNRVCPVEAAGGLETPIRKFIQNPNKILKPYISKDMTVLDFGCGPGFFTIEIAKMLSVNGRVIAADLQDGMLDKVRSKIKGTDIEKKITLSKCEKDEIGVTEDVDFILAFYVVHEVPDKKKLFAQFKSILKPGGKILIIEPNFHVTKKAFAEMISILESLGLKIIDTPKRLLSRCIVVGKV
jgi:ubiquinone/menaquinone biosynthesis C-methylase UbiE